MTNIELDGWFVREDYHGPFSRTFVAEPTEALISEVETLERYKGKTIEATYDAKVLSVRVRWDWDDKKKLWWGQSSVTLGRLNPKTGELYSVSNWKSNPLMQSYSFSGGRLPIPDYITALREVTNPRTIVTVTEAPA